MPPNPDQKIIAFSAVVPEGVELKEDLVGKEENEEGSDLSTEPNARAPSILEVSMVTVVARPMTADELDKALEFIKKSKDYLGKLYDKGKDFYDTNKETIKGAFKAIQGIGSIIGGIMKFFPDKEDPMVKKLADLEQDVQKLGKQLGAHFDEIKSLITEVSFVNKIISPTVLLTKYMRDCIKNPGEQATKNFKKAYEDIDPLTLHYNLNAFLSKETTNPLVRKMATEKVKLNSTFEAWENKICLVMAQFIVLEAFASGLLEHKNNNLELLTEASDEVFEYLQGWKNQYKKDQSYWAELQGSFEKYFESHRHLNNTQKANEMEKLLADYMTDDAFYFFIFNECKWNQQFTWYCSNEKEQVVAVRNKGGVNAFVYRSRTGSKRDQSSYQELRMKMRDTEQGMLRWTGSLQNVIENQLLEQAKLKPYGFVGLVESRMDPIMKYFNYPEPHWQNRGPGDVRKVVMDLERGDRREYIIVVSFK